MATARAEIDTGLVKGLGLIDATTIVMGSMIGSGIFIVSADIARQVQSPGLLIVVWGVATVLTLMAALSYGELAAAMPQAGGQYIYLREAFGPFSAFLFGWTSFLVIQTGTVAAVAVAFAKYTGVFVPWISTETRLLGLLNTQQILGIAVVVLLTWINSRGIRTGAMVQNVFTFAKTAALIGLILCGFFIGRRPEAVAANFGDFWRGADWSADTIRLVGVAMVGALFSADAWFNVTYTAGETRNPKRNLPLSLGLGVGLVCILYVVTNYVYLNVLTLGEIQNAAEDRVATAAAARMFGPVAVQLMAGAIMISTFGCANGILMAGARLYYAMARDGLFFERAAKVDPVHHTPTFALWIQCVWTCVLTLSGRYNDLLDYVIFAVLLFYMLTIGGLFVLRRTRPEMDRPYRAIGYPVIPALYLVLAGILEVLLLRYKPSYTFPGLIIVLLGVPVYFLWRKRGIQT